MLGRSFDGKHELKYAARRHTYELDGEPVPGVTTFIKASLPEGEAIVNWRARKAAEYISEYWRAAESEPSSAAIQKAIQGSLSSYKVALSAAGDIGTALHEYIQAYESAGSDKGHELVYRRFDGTGSPELQQARLAYTNYRATQPPLALIASERPVASVSCAYAGTFDRLHKREGRVVLSDFKTSRRAYFSHWVQLGAYSLAIREWLGVAVDELEILRFGKDGSFEALTETDPKGILKWEDQAKRCRETYEKLKSWEAVK
jgi:hypothetical protein